MQAERWQKIEEIFNATVKLPAAERETFVRDSCAEDVELSEEIFNLISVSETTDDFLSEPVFAIGAQLLDREFELLLADPVFGPYRLQRILGRGGIGAVFIAEDVRLGRAVALKILPSILDEKDERVRRFQLEARTASSVSHPNIAHIYEFGEHRRHYFLAMEFVDGTNLRAYLRQEKPDEETALRIITQTAKALQAAHRGGIIHRDIKPENIMLTADNSVKVLDFGLAKPTESLNPENPESAAPQLVDTQPGMIMGSVRYMSPEQARGQTVDARTDIWSLGVVLFEMVTGTTPFRGTATGDTLAAVIHLEPRPLAALAPDAPVELQRIIRKSLQKDRNERYQSIRDLAIDLKNLLYDLEHEISLENRAQFSGEQRWDISENPTIIHQTSGANHPTHISATPVQTMSGEESPDKTSGGIPQRMLLFSLAGLVILAVLGFGFYRWSNVNSQPVTQNFEKFQPSVIATDGKAFSPIISPDGKYIAYINGEIGNTSLVVRQISTDSTVTVVPPSANNVFSVIFSPDGDYIYYLQSSNDYVLNTLYRVPTLGGAPKKLIEDVDSQVTFSPDKKQITFHRNVSKNASVIIFTANADGTNMQEIIRSDQTAFNVLSNPKWSPDGKKILLRAYNNFGGVVEKNQLGEVDVEKKSFTVLPMREWFSMGNVTWLNDNSGFLFTGQETQNSAIQIWRATYPQMEVHPVTNDTNNYEGLGLSADAKTIVTQKSNVSSSIWTYNTVSKELKQLTGENQNREGATGLFQTSQGKIFYTRRTGTQTTLWIMEEDGSNARPFNNDITNLINSPVVTPDGRYVLFSLKSASSICIWRADADGKNLTQLTNNAQGGDYSPQPTADGKTVVYQRTAHGVNADTDFMKVPIEGGEPEVFYQDDRYNVSNQIISPDGKFVAFNSFRKEDYNKTIRVAAIENNSIGHNFKDFNADDVNSFRWSPDGKSLTFQSNQNGTPNLWKLAIDDSPVLPITDFKSGRVFNYAWSRDGKTLFIVRGTVNTELVLLRDSGNPSSK